MYCQRLHSNFTFHFFYLKEIFGGGGGLHVYMFSIIHTKKFEKTQTSAIYRIQVLVVLHLEMIEALQHQSHSLFLVHFSTYTCVMGVWVLNMIYIMLWLIQIWYISCYNWFKYDIYIMSWTIQIIWFTCRLCYDRFSYILQTWEIKRKGERADCYIRLLIFFILPSESQKLLLSWQYNECLLGK